MKLSSSISLSSKLVLILRPFWNRLCRCSDSSYGPWFALPLIIFYAILFSIKLSSYLCLPSSWILFSEKMGLWSVYLRSFLLSLRLLPKFFSLMTKILLASFFVFSFFLFPFTKTDSSKLKWISPLYFIYGNLSHFIFFSVFTILYSGRFFKDLNCSSSVIERNFFAFELFLFWSITNFSLPIR